MFGYELVTIRHAVMLTAVIAMFGFSQDVYVHWRYNNWNPFAAFKTCSTLIQCLAVVSAFAAVCVLVPGKTFRYYWTYYTWNERAAQDRERETREESAPELAELNKSILKAANIVAAATGATGDTSRCLNK
jgi:hypothetical protein